MLTTLDLGLIYGLMVLGVYFTFRALDIVGLTVGSLFTTGAAVAAVMITAGQNLWFVTLGGLFAGCVAGTVTDLLHVNAGIHPLLTGILTQIGLYSINLHILDKANVPLFRGVETLLTPLRDKGLFGSWISIPTLAALIAIVTTLFDRFPSIRIGLGVRSTGDNEGMARAQGASTGMMKIIGLALSNDLVASSGAITAQYQGYADISMDIGLIVVGLASIIIDTALIGSQGVWVTPLLVIIGSIMYRVIIQLVPSVKFPEANDMKLISAVIVLAALMIPRIGIFSKIRERHRNRSLIPEPDVTCTPEERDNEKVVF